MFGECVGVLDLDEGAIGNHSIQSRQKHCIHPFPIGKIIFLHGFLDVAGGQTGLDSALHDGGGYSVPVAHGLVGGYWLL